MARLWVRVMKDHRIQNQLAVDCAWGDEKDALTDVCKQLDIARPIWLAKHEREFESFRRTAFTRDHFIEDIGFDKLEIEFLDDTGVKRKSKDPRNDFSF